MYALLDLKPGKELHKMKGVSEKQNPHLNFQKYKDAYLQSEIVKGTNISIRRNRNKTDMETREQEKNALTPFDNKRVWIDSNQSEPYGLKSAVYDEKSIVKRIAFIQCWLATTINFRKIIHSNLTYLAMMMFWELIWMAFMLIWIFICIVGHTLLMVKCGTLITPSLSEQQQIYKN